MECTTSDCERLRKRDASREEIELEDQGEEEEEEEEEVVVTEYVIVYERDQNAEKYDQNTLVAFNPLDAYSFNPNDIVMAERRQVQTSLKTQPKITTKPTSKPSARITSTAFGKQTSAVAPNFVRQPDQSFASSMVFQTSLSANLFGTTSPNAYAQGEGKYDPTLTIVVVSFSILVVALFVGFGYCLLRMATNTGSVDKKSGFAEGIEAGTTEMKSKSLNMSDQGLRSLKQSSIFNASGDSKNIAIVTDNPGVGKVSKYQIFSPGGKNVPKRSQSIVNASFPRAFGTKKKEDIQNISPPQLVWQGNQLLAESGQLVDDSHQTTNNKGREDDGGRRFSSSYSISTVSDGAKEPEYHYKVSVPWIPQRFDELALTPGDRVIVYHIYEDGWCEGRNETTGNEGVFPLACLCDRFCVPGDHTIDDDARTLSGAQGSNFGIQANGDFYVDLNQEQESTSSRPQQALYPTTAPIHPAVFSSTSIEK
ncbi:hypothetical protein HDU97_002433 [Phlyctochytrium planicorne]|nr:hypothetical protein HDU97_002433 [Phlyctochytrium planicorne]